MRTFIGKRTLFYSYPPPFSLFCIQRQSTKRRSSYVQPNGVHQQFHALLTVMALSIEFFFQSRLYPIGKNCRTVGAALLKWIDCCDGRIRKGGGDNSVDCRVGNHIFMKRDATRESCCAMKAKSPFTFPHVH